MNSRHRASKSWSGFTLLEILTTVAIIGVLAALSLGPIQAAQRRNRDTQRKADLNLIAQALEGYYANERAYPTSTSVPACPELRSTTSAEPWIENLAPYLTGTQGNAYAVPRDPLHGKNPDFFYTYQCSVDEPGKSFRLTAILENQKDPEGTTETIGGETYRIYAVER